MTNDGNPADVITRDLGSINIDCIAKAAKTITFEVGGQSFTLPYGVLMAGVGAAADQEWEHRNDVVPAPEPVPEVVIEPELEVD